jgi:hypothetical protein
MDELNTELKIEIPRERMPWVEITDAERVQRLREVIKRDQNVTSAMRREVGELREILMQHQHGASGLLVPAERRCHGQAELAQGCKPGQEWF